jgi:AcrR family transcriptional regulator
MGAKKKNKDIDNPKSRIMETALRLFYTQGYNNTGINQILEESKTFKLSFYNYFSSKENLGIEYIKLREKTFLQLMKRIMKKHPEYHKFVKIWILVLKKEIFHQKYKGCPFINITLQTFDKEEVFKPHIKSMIAKWKKLLSNYFENEQNLSKELADKKAGLFLKVFEGTIQLYMATGNYDYIQNLEEDLISIL